MTFVLLAAQADRSGCGFTIVNLLFALTCGDAVDLGEPGGIVVLACDHARMSGHDIVADPAALRAAAAKLDAVASDLERYARSWTRDAVLQRVQDPGSDPVSVQLKQNLITMGEHAGLWMLGYSRQVRAAQEGLLAQAEAYERVEREAADRMRRL